MKRRLEKRLAVPQSSSTPVSSMRRAKIVGDLADVAVDSARLLPSGAMSRSWKVKNFAPRMVNISKATSAFSRAAAMPSPNQGRSKVWPPKGSPPGQAKECQ